MRIAHNQGPSNRDLMRMRRGVSYRRLRAASPVIIHWPEFFVGMKQRSRSRVGRSDR